MTEFRTEIDRIKGNVEDSLSAVAEKGVSVPDGSNSDVLAGLIRSIEAGGGLPDGISALAGGTFTPSSSKSEVAVAHGLGVTPNFYVVVLEEDVSETALNRVLTYSMAVRKTIKKSSSSSSIQYVNGVVGGYTTSSSHSYLSIAKTAQTYFDDTSVNMIGDSYYPFSSGYTYRWICGVLDGIQ